MRLLAILFALVLVVPDAIGHPGHGVHPSDTVEHYVFSPVHTFPMLAAGLLFAGVCAVIVATVRSRRTVHAIDS